MAIQTLTTIKNWFRTSLKPSQQQFWDTWDSFRHKFEKVPVKDIEGIDELLLTKADKTVLDNHLADKSAHAPQVNTDWNSESGFSQLINKPEFKTINGETIVGTGNIGITTESPNLQSVLDTNPAANYGNSSATIMGNYGDFKYNNLTVGNDTDRSSMLQLTNQVGFQYSKVGINTESNITVSESGVNIKRSLNGKTTDIVLEDPTVNTLLKIPAKSEEGNTYTIATTDDFKTINGESIVGAGDITIEAGGSQNLQQTLANGNTTNLKSIFSKGNYVTTVDPSFITIQHPEQGYLTINPYSIQLQSPSSTGSAYLSGNNGLSIGNGSTASYLQCNPLSNQNGVYLFPINKGFDPPRTLATTDDFKTINGESIVGEGDITIEGGATPDATTTVKGIMKLAGDLGGTADAPTTPTAVHKTGNESINGLKSINNSLSNSARFTFNTFNDATNSTLDATTTSSTIPAMVIRANTSNSTGLLVSAFSSNYIGVKIEPTQNSPQGGKMLVLSNAKAVNNAVDIATPLTVLRDGATVSSISDLGNITGNSFIKTGGTASQFLKADGSIDSNVYANDDNLVHKTGNLTESIDGDKTFLTRTVFNGQTQFGSLITFTNASQVLPSAIVPSLARYDGGIAFLGTGSSDTKFTLTSNNVHTGIFKYVMPDISGTLALKSDIPTNIITGTGTANYIPKFTLSGVLGNGSIYDNGNVLIGTTTDNGAKLQVNGNAKFAGTITASPATLSTELVTKAQLDAGAGTSGSYTATVSEITNVSINGIGRMSNYIKVGNIVSVQASVNLNIIASSTLSRFRISLPINIAGSTTNFYCGQGIVFTTSAGVPAYPCQVYLNGGTEAIVQFNSEIGMGPRDVSFNFQYDITKFN